MSKKRGKRKRIKLLPTSYGGGVAFIKDQGNIFTAVVCEGSAPYLRLFCDDIKELKHRLFKNGIEEK